MEARVPAAAAPPSRSLRRIPRQAILRNLSGMALAVRDDADLRSAVVGVLLADDDNVGRVAAAGSLPGLALPARPGDLLHEQVGCRVGGRGERRAVLRAEPHENDIPLGRGVVRGDADRSRVAAIDVTPILYAGHGQHRRWRVAVAHAPTLE